MLDRRACRKTSAYTIRDTRLLALASDVLDELATASLRDVDGHPAPILENVSNCIELVRRGRRDYWAGRLCHKAIGDSRLRTALP